MLGTMNMKKVYKYNVQKSRLGRLQELHGKGQRGHIGKLNF